MACEYCGGDCPYCSDTDEAAWFRKHEKELKEFCEGHAWNSTPAEVAEDIRDQGFEWREVKKAMAECGYNADSIDQVDRMVEILRI